MVEDIDWGKKISIPKERWMVRITVSRFVNVKNVRCWESFDIRELPNDNISINDLESIGIKLVNTKSVRGSEV